jgi:hypothetical protein
LAESEKVYFSHAHEIYSHLNLPSPPGPPHIRGWSKNGHFLFSAFFTGSAETADEIKESTTATAAPATAASFINSRLVLFIHSPW